MDKSMSNILLFSVDALPSNNELAAGPGIRYWELAKSLSEKGHDITLAAPKESFSDQRVGEFSITPWDLDNIVELSKQKDCVILPHVHCHLSKKYADEVDKNIPTVVDLYDPVLIENLNLQTANREGLKTFSN